eukprot:scaffold16408_cov59-Isochrysis_galbana.AAC.2
MGRVLGCARAWVGRREGVGEGGRRGEGVGEGGGGGGEGGEAPLCSGCELIKVQALPQRLHALSGEPIPWGGERRATHAVPTTSRGVGAMHSGVGAMYSGVGEQAESPGGGCDGSQPSHRLSAPPPRRRPFLARPPTILFTATLPRLLFTAVVTPAAAPQSRGGRDLNFGRELRLQPDQIRRRAETERAAVAAPGGVACEVGRGGRAVEGRGGGF